MNTPLNPERVKVLQMRATRRRQNQGKGFFRGKLSPSCKCYHCGVFFTSKGIKQHQRACLPNTTTSHGEAVG